MRILVFVVILIWICAAGPTGGSQGAGAKTSQKQQPKATRYTCPMDPEVTSNKAGKCQKCGMALRLAADKSDAEGAPLSSPGSEGAENTAALSSSRIPNVRVYDENGKALSFYSDLVRGKTVAINFIFTTCTTICPPLTATFRRVQQDLAKQAPGVHLISVSVDPTTDTPERLLQFRAKFKAGPGWTFVTGDKAEINSLLRALGTAVADKNDHTPMILIGNDRADYWTRSYGLSSPESLVRLIAEAASRK